MPTLAYTVPVAGSTLNSIADPEVATALTSILAWAAAISPSVGATNIAASQSTSSTTYTTLSTPDQVTGIVLPTNGLIAVWYQATWQESVQSAASAAIFIGSNQFRMQGFDGTTHGPLPQAAITQNGIGIFGINLPLFSFPGGLGTVHSAAAYGADVTTGQGVGFGGSTGSDLMVQSMNGQGIQSPVNVPFGGPCLIDGLSAGTYTISVQFKASSGSVTASNRRLRVSALSFS